MYNLRNTEPPVNAEVDEEKCGLNGILPLGGYCQFKCKPGYGIEIQLNRADAIRPSLHRRHHLHTGSS